MDVITMAKNPIVAAAIWKEAVNSIPLVKLKSTAIAKVSPTIQPAFWNTVAKPLED